MTKKSNNGMVSNGNGYVTMMALNGTDHYTANGMAAHFPSEGSVHCQSGPGELCDVDDSVKSQLVVTLGQANLRANGGPVANLDEMNTTTTTISSGTSSTPHSLASTNAHNNLYALEQIEMYDCFNEKDVLGPSLFTQQRTMTPRSSSVPKLNTTGQGFTGSSGFGSTQTFSDVYSSGGHQVDSGGQSSRTSEYGHYGYSDYRDCSGPMVNKGPSFDGMANTAASHYPTLVMENGRGQSWSSPHHRSTTDTNGNGTLSSPHHHYNGHGRRTNLQGANWARSSSANKLSTAPCSPGTTHYGNVPSPGPVSKQFNSCQDDQGSDDKFAAGTFRQWNSQYATDAHYPLESRQRTGNQRPMSKRALSEQTSTSQFVRFSDSCTVYKYPSNNCDSTAAAAPAFPDSPVTKHSSSNSQSNRVNGFRHSNPVSVAAALVALSTRESPDEGLGEESCEVIME